MRQVKKGDKFKLLGEVWTVDGFAARRKGFYAEADDTCESIWLDLSKTDKLEWIEEAKPEELSKFERGMLKFKSEIIRETLEMVAEAWEADVQSFSEPLRKKAREI